MRPTDDEIQLARQARAEAQRVRQVQEKIALEEFTAALAQMTESLKVASKRVASAADKLVRARNPS